MATVEELERLFPLLKESVAAEVSQKLDLKTTEIELKAKEAASIKIAEQVCLASFNNFLSFLIEVL